MRTSPPLAPPAFEEDDFWRLPPRPGSSPATRHKSRLAGAGSLLLHTAMVSALVWLTPFSSPPPASSTKTRIINARLYTSPAPLVPPQHVGPESDKSPHSPAFQPAPSGQPVSEGGNSILKTPTTMKTPTRRASPAAAQSDTSRQSLPQQPEVPVTPSADPAAVGSGSVSRPSLPVSAPPSVGKRDSVKQATASYFSAVQAQQQDQLAAGAARQFQQGKTTRTLHDTRTITQIQAVPDPAAPVTVNCAGKVNQSLAFVSMLSGGKLKCSEPTKHLQQTIDKRVQQHTGKR